MAPVRLLADSPEEAGRLLAFEDAWRRAIAAGLDDASAFRMVAAGDPATADRYLEVQGEMLAIEIQNALQCDP